VLICLLNFKPLFIHLALVQMPSSVFVVLNIEISIRYRALLLCNAMRSWRQTLIQEISCSCSKVIFTAHKSGSEQDIIFSDFLLKLRRKSYADCNSRCCFFCTEGYL